METLVLALAWVCLSMLFLHMGFPAAIAWDRMFKVCNKESESLVAYVMCLGPHAYCLFWLENSLLEAHCSVEALS